MKSFVSNDSCKTLKTMKSFLSKDSCKTLKYNEELCVVMQGSHLLRRVEVVYLKGALVQHLQLPFLPLFWAATETHAENISVSCTATNARAKRCRCVWNRSRCTCVLYARGDA